MMRAHRVIVGGAVFRSVAPFNGTLPSGNIAGIRCGCNIMCFASKRTKRTQFITSSELAQCTVSCVLRLSEECRWRYIYTIFPSSDDYHIVRMLDGTWKVGRGYLPHILCYILAPYSFLQYKRVQNENSFRSRSQRLAQ